MSEWADFLKEEKTKPYFRNILSQLDTEYSHHTVYPQRSLIFNALKQTPLDKVKVVIIGQDPYHGVNEAHGLSFSVPQETKIPPSLRNIFKELCSDLDINYPSHGNLDHWAKQGVLLLNSTLTVRHKQPRSHHGLGWQNFTQRVIKTVSDAKPYVVFILWGSDAQTKRPLIDARHGVISSVHPSPLSAHRGFFGSKPFSKTNELLASHQLEPIDWAIPS